MLGPCWTYHIATEGNRNDFRPEASQLQCSRPLFIDPRFLELSSEFCTHGTPIPPALLPSPNKRFPWETSQKFPEKDWVQDHSFNLDYDLPRILEPRTNRGERAFSTPDTSDSSWAYQETISFQKTWHISLGLPYLYFFFFSYSQHRHFSIVIEIWFTYTMMQKPEGISSNDFYLHMQPSSIQPGKC